MYEYALPLVEDKNEEFWYLYNKQHAKEHQDMASWINALAKAKNLDYQISYYVLPVLDFNDKESVKNFFEVNWKQHMLFYDILNKIGQSLTIPVFVFPKNYPSFEFDMDKESFLKIERDIHLMLWRAIDVIKQSL